jgi:hypothetical protein
LIKAFNYISHIGIYPRIDLTAWCGLGCIAREGNQIDEGGKENEPDGGHIAKCNKQISDNIPFSHFLKETLYYKLHRECEGDDYVVKAFETLTKHN